MRARASISALGELEGGGHPASPVFLKAQGQREGARGRGDDDGDFRVPGVEGAHAYVYRGGAPGAGGEVDVCEGACRAPVTTSTMARASVAAQGPGSGSAWLSGEASARQTTRAEGARGIGRSELHRNGEEGLGWECAGLVWARDADAEALRGLGVMCVLMASPGEW